MSAEEKNNPETKKVDLKLVETLASIGCTLKEIGLGIGLSKRQVQRRQKSEAFHDAIERGRAKGGISLRRAQWKAAVEEGNVTAQIWLGKQMLGQRSFEREEKKEAPDRPEKVIYEWVPRKKEEPPA